MVEGKWANRCSHRHRLPHHPHNNSPRLCVWCTNNCCQGSDKHSTCVCDCSFLISSICYSSYQICRSSIFVLVGSSVFSTNHCVPSCRSFSCSCSCSCSFLFLCSIDSSMDHKRCLCPCPWVPYFCLVCFSYFFLWNHRVDKDRWAHGWEMR